MAFWDDWFDSGDDYSYSDTYGDGGPDANGNWDNNWGGQSDTTNYNSSGSDWGWLSGVGEFYDSNKSWIDPVVGFGKEYYKADKASDLADEYKQRMQPSIDFNKEAVARQRAYYDPATAQKAIGAEAARTAGYLTDAWSKQDQPTYANAYARGMLNSDPFARSRATTSTARDKYWTEQAMPAIEDRYYNRGTTLSNADTATSRMLTGDPTLQPTYTQADYRSDPFDNALINYFNRG